LPRKRFSGDPGDAIRFSSYGESTPHLYVVVTPPDGNPPQVVIVNLTSKRRHSDTTVVLRPTHHPFLDRETVVNFNKARIVRVETLMHRIEDGIAEAREAFSEDVLKVIQKGVLQSKRTPLHIQKYCRKFCGPQCQ